MPTIIATFVGVDRTQVAEEASAFINANNGTIVYSSAADDIDVDLYKHVGLNEMTNARGKPTMINHYEAGKHVFVIVVKAPA